MGAGKAGIFPPSFSKLDTGFGDSPTHGNQRLHKCAIQMLAYSILNLQFKTIIKKISNVEKPMSQTKINKLREKKAQIDARIKLIESRQRSQTRKNDTRRKIIAGALALHHAEKNPEDLFSIKLFRLLNEYVTKPFERSLFDLPPIAEESEKTAANDSNREQIALKESFKIEN